jgi:hypothetical protein
MVARHRNQLTIAIDALRRSPRSVFTDRRNQRTYRISPQRALGQVVSGSCVSRRRADRPARPSSERDRAADGTLWRRCRKMPPYSAIRSPEGPEGRSGSPAPCRREGGRSAHGRTSLMRHRAPTRASVPSPSLARPVPGRTMGTARTQQDLLGPRGMRRRGTAEQDPSATIEVRTRRAR